MDDATELIQISLSPDSRDARLLIPGEAASGEVTTETVLSRIEDAGVALTDDVRERVEAIVDAWEPGTSVEEVISEATSAQHGEDGRVEWGIDGEPVEHEAGESGESLDSYYERSAFVMVREGQVLGRVVEPTEAVDGMDVTGRKLGARRGRAARLVLDETIEHRVDGQLVALRSGALSRGSESATIREFLEIEGGVDFSTGNIQFTGDIHIRQGIRDRFSVRTTGDLEVHGLIEAASIDIEGTLYAKGGMAGREQGWIRTRGDINAKYLHGVRIECGGDLSVTREIHNCTTLVQGAIVCPGGTLMGGRTTVTGKAQLGTIGSDGHVATELVLGTVPGLDPKLESMQRLLHEMEAEKGSLEQESSTLGALGPSGDHAQTIRRQITALEIRCTHCRKALVEFRRRVDRVRRIDVEVLRVAHAGSRFCANGRLYTLNEDLPGPVTIACDRSGALHAKTASGHRMALSSISGVEVPRQVA